MKKTKKVLFVAVILAVAFTAMPIIAQDSNSESLYPVSNFKIPKFKDELYIQPDPSNPYQGTWIIKTSRNRIYMYVIKDMEATGYSYGGMFGWLEQGIYRIDNTWILSENNTILDTPSIPIMGGKIILERYIKN